MQRALRKQTTEQITKQQRAKLEMESMKNRVTLMHGKKAIE
jgi:hypothetical protein